MFTYVSILAGAIIGYAVGGFILPSAEGSALGGRFVLAMLGALVGWWGASFAGGRVAIAWDEGVTQVRSPGEFDALVSKSADEPLLVDFYANWCPPCRRGAPNINALAKEGRRVAVVNVDDNPTLARRFGVSSIPTLFVLRNGEVVQQAQGYHSAEDLRHLVEAAGPTGD